MIVRVFNPRKSNLTRPADSTSPISNCEATVPLSESKKRGVKSVRAVGAITTPAACVPTLLDKPSNFKAISKTSFDSSDSSMVSLNCFSL